MKKLLRSYGIIFAGSVLYSLAFAAFFEANQVGMAGVTGLAQVGNVLFPALSVGALTFLLNVPIFLVGWRLLGFHLLASSLFSMAVSSAAIDLFGLWRFPAMDPMLAALCGGALMGLLSKYGRPEREYYGWMCPNCGGFRAALDPKTLELTILEELPGEKPL